MVSHSGGDDYLVVPPKGKTNGRKDIRLQLEVPEFLQSHGQGECEDIVKVSLYHHQAGRVPLYDSPQDVSQH